MLPFGQPRAGRRWLLKMHGDVQRPGSLVLTREQYLRFDELNAALAGVVQALLLTRHMLFVGFSLVDDNFARLAHQVHRVLRGGQAQRKVGTVLALRKDPARERLYQADLEHLAMAAAVRADEKSDERAAE